MYGVREVVKLLRMPRSAISSLVKAGFVSPARGPRNAWRFSFQDLIVLRTAQALAAANVPRKRINRSVRELRRHLPGSMPLSGLSISAVADRVVVKEGRTRWQADSGQYLLAFEGDPAAGSLKVIEPQKPQPAPAEPGTVDARIEAGVSLHESGKLAEAERVYREALKDCGREPLLLYNLGVLLDELGRKHDAAEAYREALRVDARFADCHYNLALLCEELGRPRDAIRHMSEYRRLTGSRGGSPHRR